MTGGSPMTQETSIFQLRHVRARTLRCGKSASATWMQRRDSGYSGISGFPWNDTSREGASLETAVSSSSFSIQSCFGAAAGGGVWSPLSSMVRSYLISLIIFAIPSKLDLTKPWLDKSLGILSCKTTFGQLNLAMENSLFTNALPTFSNWNLNFQHSMT